MTHLSNPLVCRWQGRAWVTVMGGDKFRREERFVIVMVVVVVMVVEEVVSEGSQREVPGSIWFVWGSHGLVILCCGGCWRVGKVVGEGRGTDRRMGKGPHCCMSPPSSVSEYLVRRRHEY
ncbi:hypothetical protein E2C01_003364 [Portunus trituberculatus]|uniref:Transmembrane protein n=1 Tax=Portunus trituberculatus TaxID=210409 RepID=A0A5B7CPZ6_PORTR|nr:hypothetical protein [Portunus trituberculatus]